MNPDDFNLTDKLYHYTSLESMIKIINSGIIKFGALPQMNDITEALEYIYSSMWWNQQNDMLIDRDRNNLLYESTYRIIDI